MEIRRLTIEDYEEILKVWSKTKLPYKPHGRDSKAAINKAMKENPNFFSWRIRR